MIKETANNNGTSIRDDDHCTNDDHNYDYK